MASYDAQINLLVGGLRELDRLSDRLRSIEKQIVDINRLGVRPQQRDPITGRFGSDPDRANRIRASRLQDIARREERLASFRRKSIGEQNAELIKEITLQSRLNSAVDLYQRKLEEYGRGGKGAKLTDELRSQVEQIQRAYEVATSGGRKNLSLVRSLATELGRVVERQNEINRSSSLQSKGFFKSQDFERRIAALREQGVPAQSFATVGRQMSEYRSAIKAGNQPQAEDVARRIRENLNRLTRELDQVFAEFKKGESAKRAAKSWETFFEDASNIALQIKQNAKNTKLSWQSFFEDAAYQAMQIKENAKKSSNAWKLFFENAAYQAFQIAQNAKETKASWQSFFQDAAYQAIQIKQNAKETKTSWQLFFEDAAYQAIQIKQNAKETKASWQLFFEDAAYQAFQIKQNAKETRLAWQQFFTDAEKQAKAYRSRPVAAMTPQERVSQGILDPESLSSSRRQRVAAGRSRQESIRRAASEGLVGGAFPLLFGQGLGASVGGGFGGAAGGFAGGGLGFGLSLVGTALGAAFDTAVQGATELGAALNDTTQTFDKVKERALFSSKETEKYATKLEEAGFIASAAVISQQEIISKIGRSGFQSLQRLADSSDRLNRAWAEFNLQLQAALAGPMAGLLEWIARIVDIGNQRGRSEAAARDLIPQDAADRARFEKELTATFNKTFGTNFTGKGTPRGSIEATIKYLSFDEEGRAALADLSKKFPPIELKATLSRDQKIKEEIASLTKQLEAIDIGRSIKDQVRQTAREQQDLDKQRADLAISYERSIGDIRKRIEDEVSNRRFSVLEKENQLLEQQSENRLNSLNLINQKFIAQAGVGQRSEVEDTAKKAAEIVAQFTEQQLSTEEKTAEIKRKAALDALKFDFQASQFKANIEKEVSRLNIDTARRVADINEQVRRRNEDNDNRKFQIEKKIADLKLRIMLNELGIASRDASLTMDMRQEAAKVWSIVNTERAAVEKLSAPPAVRGVGQVGGAGVSMTNIDAIVAQEKSAIDEIVNSALEGQDILTQQGLQNFRTKILDLTNSIDAPIKTINQGIIDSNNESTRYLQLTSQGMSDIVAQKVIEIERTRDLAILNYDALIVEFEKRKAIEGTTEAIRAQIDIEIQGIKDRQEALRRAAGEAPQNGQPATGLIGKAIKSQSGKKIQDYISRGQAQLKDLEGTAVGVAESIENSIGSSISNAVSGLIQGTTEAQEVFSAFMSSVSEILIQKGAAMIATYIAIGIARIFAGLGGGAGGEGPGGIPSTGNAGAPSIQMPKGEVIDSGAISNIAAKGAYFDGAMSYFAKGGIVSSPTMFQFADGGAIRNGLMGEAGPEAIMPLSRGSDGRLGVDAKGLRDAMSGGNAGSTAPVLNMSFETTSINGVEYVSRDQLEAAMATTRRQAAKDGAKQGMSMTLDRLQQSPKTRSRVGLR